MTSDDIMPNDDYNGLRIFTNGTFDGFHKGHYDLLKVASKIGRVYLGLNSDESVRKLKGPHRPFYSFNQRYKTIFDTGFVEEIYKIEEEKNINYYIQYSRCDFLLKGSDTLTDMKYPKITGKENVKAIIYIDVGDMSIHSSDLHGKDKDVEKS